MSQRRVLMVRVGAMGDVLHALPAVTALRRMWPEAAIDWVVDPRWAPLLVDEAGRGPVVSRVHLAETKIWSHRPASWKTVRSVMGLRRALDAGRYGTVVDVQGTLRSAMIGRMAGSEERVGFADPREFAARLFYTKAMDRRGVHVVEQNAALLGDALGVRLEPAMPALPVCEAAEDCAERAHGGFSVRGRIALLAPAAGWGAKQWPAERFGALARALGEMGFEVMVNAAGRQDAVAMEVVRGSAGAAQMACGDLARLVALTRRAAVVVGGDSGPVHLAAALGRPVVALFGPTDPARNGPWGAGPKRVLRDAGSVTSYKRMAAVEAGLERIGVEQVVGGVRQLLGAVAG